jgi:hypothetical protein
MPSKFFLCFFAVILLQVSSVSCAFASPVEYKSLHESWFIPSELPVLLQIQSSPEQLQLEQLREKVKELELAIAPKNKFSDLEKELTEVKTQLASKPKVEELEKKLDTLRQYNSDLLNTVFFSLLGTVATISLTIFGIDFFSRFMNQEKEKEAVIKFLGNHLEEYCSGLVGKYTSSLNRKILWLEYQGSTLIADNLSEKDIIFGKYLSFEERLRALETLCQLSSQRQGDTPNRCIEFELDAIQLSLEGILSKSQSVQTSRSLSEADKNMKNKALQRLEDGLSELKDNIASSKVQDILLLIKKNKVV